MSLQCSKWRGYERWGHPSSLRLCQSLIVRLTDNKALCKHPYRAEPATSWKWQMLQTYLDLQHIHRRHNWPAETGLDLKPALCKNEKWAKLQIKVLLIQSMIIHCSARAYKLIRIEPWWGTGSLAGSFSCVCMCVRGSKLSRWPDSLSSCQPEDCSWCSPLNRHSCHANYLFQPY